MTNKIYIFDSHPVQYKAPVYQAMEKLSPGLFEVIYATDASVRGGNVDKGFGVEVKWDTPLLSGHKFRVLNNEKGRPFVSASSLTGKGVFNLLRHERPAAVMLTQARYHFDHAAYLSALILDIPILIRQETQDEMYSGSRSALKECVRYIAYRLLYTPVRHAFCFGHLNRLHLTRHGIRPSKMSMAHFSVPDLLKNYSKEQKQALRTNTRSSLGIADDALVLAFFGKLIPKKNPTLIFDALAEVSQSTKSRLHLLFVGSGELETELKLRAADAQLRWSIKSSFTGFINQQSLPAYYLASDIVALPSRKMGEAWGLVMNEAMGAGCAVIMSDAVGCSHEFGAWERARVVPEGESSSLAKAIDEVACYPRSFDWAQDQLAAYSTETVASELVRVFKQYSVR